MSLTTKIDRAAAKAQGPLPAGHPLVRAGRIGVLLVNLGTPDGTSFWPMWRYLREFLSDRRVIGRAGHVCFMDSTKLSIPKR